MSALPDESPSSTRGLPFEDVLALAAQLEAGIEELTLAGAMLGDAMRKLRDGFAQATAPEAAGASAQRAGIHQVMVALQTEDTLGQLLQAARRRQALLAQALREAASEGAAAQDLPIWRRAPARWGDAHCAAPGGRPSPEPGPHEFF
ncbi:hypothetical protein [uncultured Pseudacidovorax sp.]|uniref:hypothetical protein n=1 Tax=uncultured Pseudacidovorax sp. TaxID=679313 RepID=UPI0025EA31CD|nr:hypothetical protein [uncultured Pseudacidovorax sp.]